MASKREIKNDVNYLTNEVLVDGIMMMSLYENKQDEIMAKLEQVAAARNQFVEAVQHPENKFKRMPREERGKTKAARSKAFKKVVNSRFDAFASALDSAYEFLGTLAEEKK